MSNKNTEDETFNKLKYHVEVDRPGTRRYYNTNGVLHREEGPAVEWVDGHKYWVINGKYVSKTEHQKWIYRTHSTV